MPEPAVDDLRLLRRRCRKLNELVVADYREFFDATRKHFFRLPTAPPTSSSPISVTTSATALMALGQAQQLEKVLCPTDTSAVQEEVLSQLKLLLSAPWSSSSLPQNNAFTAAIVVRAAGLL